MSAKQAQGGRIVVTDRAGDGQGRHACSSVRIGFGVAAFGQSGLEPSFSQLP
jgi:hypothetical protein